MIDIYKFKQESYKKRISEILSKIKETGELKAYELNIFIFDDDHNYVKVSQIPGINFILTRISRAVD